MSLVYVHSFSSSPPWTYLFKPSNSLWSSFLQNATLSETPVYPPSSAIQVAAGIPRIYYFLMLAALFLANHTFHTSKTIIARLRFSKFQQQQGCQPVAVIPNPLPLPWSLGRKYEVLMAYLSGDLIANHLDKNYQVYSSTHSIASAVIGLQKGINTVEPRNMQAVLADRFDDYVRPRFRAVAAEPLMMPGLFTTDGPVWRHFRTMVKPHFTRKRFNENVIQSERHVQLFFQAISSASINGKTADVDILSPLYRLALDTSTLFLFGLSSEAQTSALVQAGLLPRDSASQSAALYGFDTAFIKAGHYLGHRMKMASLCWLYDGPEYRRLCVKLHSMVDAYIDEVCELGKSSEAPEEDSLIRMMVAQNVPRKDIIQQVLHLLIAGMDTSAAAFGWTFSMLASNPEIYQKLRASVLATFGAESAPLEVFSTETLKSCKYLTWCLNETLRLFPAGPVNVRTAVRDTVLPVGGGPDGKSPVAVRKGSRVQLGTYFMHRRKDLWGEDADEYRPERWENRKMGWDFLPFNAGPHICIGQGYSMTQLTFAVARFVQHFESIEPAPGSNNTKMGWETVLMPGDGVKVRMKLAGDSIQSTP